MSSHFKMEEESAWRELAVHIPCQLQVAREEAARVAMVWYWSQHARCLIGVKEMEERIQLAGRQRNWINDPEPVIRRELKELMKLREEWARNLARHLRS
jgi:hypothetical protein